MEQSLTSEDIIFHCRFPMKSFCVDYPWQKHLQCLSYKDFGAKRKFHSSIPKRGRLDI